MNFIESFDNKTILIPLLQRDYVQGSKESAVISPFLDALLEKDCDLNYIYGYEEDGCFVPVDGQQRLTTLWLLHLYLYARKKRAREYRVHMKFASREYANDFCERISEHLEELLSKSSSYKTLDEAIKDQSWFIQSWNKNATVCNMLNTLKLIHRKVNEHDMDTIWNKLVDSATPSVTFAFLQMDESNGLDDDIYIKMNGRGRKLSAFENLKSWMDDKVSTRPYAEEWRTEMDNCWTDMFWQNRNLEQEHPEEIDDEQLFFFYNLLILYHVKTGELLNTVTKLREEKPFLFEEMQDFFGIEAKAEKDQDIVDNIVDRLRKAGNFPLLWIDRLNLMSESFFDFANKGARAIAGLSKEFNSLDLYLGEEKVDKTTRTYRISMCEGSIGRTLPLFYALLSYRQGETTLYDWMRVMRNLILNTSISREDLPSLMSAMDDFGSLCCKENIYSVLRDSESMDILKGFNSRQIGEEVLKANQLNYYSSMTKLENGRFFSGRIGVLFNMLSLNPTGSQSLLGMNNVEAYTSVLLAIFDGKDGGCAEQFDDKEHLLRRALMTFKPYYFGMGKNGCWCFCQGLGEWREYVNTEDECRNALYSFLKEVMVPAQKAGQDLRQAVSDHLKAISCGYEQLLLSPPDGNSFRYHFIHHPGVWDYMRTKRCMWTDNYNIELKTSNGNNSDRVELRTYALYLDYCHNDDYKGDRTNWKVGIWPKCKSCMYFERNFAFEQKNLTVAIDVYFYDHQEQRNCEDSYAFDLFIRSKHPEALSEEEKLAFAEEDYQANIGLFRKLPPKLLDALERKKDGRLRSKSLYSRRGIKGILKQTMQGINHSIDTMEMKGEGA